MVVGLRQIQQQPELFCPFGAMRPRRQETPAPEPSHDQEPRHRQRRSRRRSRSECDDDEYDNDETFFGMGRGGGGGGGDRVPYDERLQALMDNRVLYDEMRRDLQFCMIGGIALLEGVIILALLNRRD